MNLRVSGLPKETTELPDKKIEKDRQADDAPNVTDTASDNQTDTYM